MKIRQHLGCLVGWGCMVLCVGAACVIPLGAGSIIAARNISARYPAAFGEADCASPVLQAYYSPGYFELRLINFSCAITAHGVEEVVAWYEAAHWRKQFVASRVAKFSGWQWGWLKLDMRRHARVHSGADGATHVNTETRLTFIAKRP